MPRPTTAERLATHDVQACPALRGVAGAAGVLGALAAFLLVVLRAGAVALARTPGTVALPFALLLGALVARGGERLALGIVGWAASHAGHPRPAPRANRTRVGRSGAIGAR
jgi:hypothetical protein